MRRTRFTWHAAATVITTMLIATTLITAAGCGAPASPPDDDRLAVVAGFYPLQFVAEQVGGDRVRVSSAASPGAEPHDLELSPRQLAEVTDADLVVYLRGFQPALDEAVDQNASAPFDVTDLVDGRVGPDGGRDPHLWLDPARLATVAHAVADRFAEADPGAAAEFQQRAAALDAALTDIDHEYDNGLRDCARREIVVSHAAFGYLADRYHLDQVAVSGLTPEIEPTPGHLAAAAQAARDHGATTIFFETLVSPRVAEVIAAEVGATTAVLDPIESVPPDGAEDYFSVMRANLAVLRTSLGCA